MTTSPPLLHAPLGTRAGQARWPAPPERPFVVLEEFLVAEELDRLRHFALSQASRFEPAEVLSAEHHSAVDGRSRRSHVLFELDIFDRLFRERLMWTLPYVLARLGVHPFPVTKMEVQLTVTHHGGFFRPHFDDDAASALGRRLSFVFYFARQPQRFRGGALRIFQSRAPDTREDGVPAWLVQPGENQVVLFESTRLHEVLPVFCPTADFADGRFTVNGWIHGPARVGQ